MFFQTLSYSSIKEILKEVNYSLAKGVLLVKL